MSGPAGPGSTAGGPARRAAARAGRAPRALPPATVTAVLVSHDGATWLPEVLAAVAAQTRAPDRLVAVDTGSTDDSRQLVADSRLAGTAVELPRRTAYPAAVAAALTAAPPVPDGPPEWVWLLHDDAAPAPDALAALLATAAASPRTALVGPVAVDWDDPGRLLEAGLGVGRDGRRRTGVEAGERDHGQYDDGRPVLAVGTAGALVRRDALEAVGGLERRLPHAGHDVDLGWRLTAAGHEVRVAAAARVRHAAAQTRGRRAARDPRRTRPAADSRRGAAVARRAGLWTLLADTPTAGLPPLLLRLLLGGALGVLAAVLRRRWRDAGAALLRGAWLLLRLPGLAAARLRRLRRLRRVAPGGRRVPWVVVRGLLPGPLADPTRPLAGLLDHVAGGAARPAGRPSRPRLPRRTLLWPAAAVAAVAAATWEGTEALRGPGVLAGGRLLGPPADLASAWTSFVTDRTAAGAGAVGGAGPRDLLLALLGTLPGLTPAAVPAVLLLGAPVLAALAAVWALGAVVADRRVRAWAGAAYGLLPAVTGAAAGGRLDTAVAAVALPLLLRGGARVLRRDPRVGGWHPVWLTGLGLAAAAAVAPVLLVAGAVLAGAGAGAVLLAAGAARGGPRAVGAATAAAGRRAVGALAPVAVAAAVLAPELPRWRQDPAALLAGPGRPGPSPAPVEPWQLLLLQPGGPGTPPLWACAGLVAAALAGLLRRDRRGAALAGWALATAGLAAGTAATRWSLDGVVVWPGAATLLAGAGLLVAAAVAAEGARERLGRRSAGGRHLLAVGVVVAALAAPVVGAAALAAGPDGPLERRPEPVETLAAAAADGGRVLLLSAGAPVAYDLVGPGGTPLHADRSVPEPRAAGRLDDAVRGLLTPDGADAAPALAAAAVRAVVLTPGGSAADRSAVAAALDAQPGLARAAGRTDLWRLPGALPPVAVLPAASARAATGGAAGPVPGTPPAVPAPDVVPVGEDGRLLVLAEAVDPDRTATVDGRRLEPAVAWGWAQAWVLPAAGGRVDVTTRTDPARTRLTGVAAAALVLAAVLAVPAGRRREEPGDGGPDRGEVAR